MNQNVSRNGFSLIELLIAMAVGLIVLGAMYSVFTLQNKQLNAQDMVTAMQQNARASIEMMVQEIRMAGYRPGKVASTWTSGTAPGIMTATATSVSFVADLDGDSDTTADSTNPGENITYELCPAATCTTCAWQCLSRTSNGTKQPFAEDIESLTFRYFDSSGTQLTAPVTGTTLSNIRRIEVTIQARSAREDPTYTSPSGDHYYHYQLVSQIALRNMGL